MADNADINQLVAAVRARDYTAQLTARTAGAAGVGALAPLLGDPDPEVRELAVHCLVEAGDAGAGALLVRAVLDVDAQVAAAAARGLQALGTSALVPELLSVLPLAREADVRREVALVIGRVAGDDVIPALRSRLAPEQAPLATEGLIAALARLGDPDARQTFADALLAARGMDRKPWLDLAVYVGQPWLLGPRGAALDDAAPVLRVGVDARPDLIQFLRVCDLALVLIADISGARLSFAVTRAKNFTPAELDEARRVVWST